MAKLTCLDVVKTLLLVKITKGLKALILSKHKALWSNYLKELNVSYTNKSIKFGNEVIHDPYMYIDSRLFTPLQSPPPALIPQIKTFIQERDILVDTENKIRALVTRMSFVAKTDADLGLLLPEHLGVNTLTFNPSNNDPVTITDQEIADFREKEKDTIENLTQLMFMDTLCDI